MSQAALENTYWILTRLHDQEVAISDSKRAPHLILHADSQRVSGYSGNRPLIGSYVVNGDRLSIGKLATGRRTSLLRLEQEAALLAALPSVTRWRIEAQQLYLLDWQGNCLMQFEATHR